jgi:hypothetical protein
MEKMVLGPETPAAYETLQKPAARFLLRAMVVGSVLTMAVLPAGSAFIVFGIKKLELVDWLLLLWIAVTSVWTIQLLPAIHHLSQQRDSSWLAWICLNLVISVLATLYHLWLFGEIIASC